MQYYKENTRKLKNIGFWGNQKILRVFLLLSKFFVYITTHVRVIKEIWTALKKEGIVSRVLCRPIKLSENRWRLILRDTPVSSTSVPFLSKHRTGWTEGKNKDSISVYPVRLEESRTATSQIAFNLRQRSICSLNLNLVFKYFMKIRSP